MEEFYANLSDMTWYGIAALLLLTYLLKICNARQFLYANLITCSVGAAFGTAAGAAEPPVVAASPEVRQKTRMTSKRVALLREQQPNDDDVTEEASELDYQLLMFHASWCGPCMRVKKNVLPKLGVKFSANGKDPIYLIDAKKSPLVMKAYNVNALPSYILLHREGEVWKPVRRASGVLSTTGFHNKFPELWK